MRGFCACLLTLLVTITPATVHSQQPAEVTLCETSGMSCDERCHPRPLWYVQADALILQRTTGSNQVLATNVGGTVPVLSLGNFRFNWDAGPRITVGRGVGESGALELSYFGLYDMRARDTFAGAGDPFGPATMATNFSANYHAVLNNAEVNYRHWLSDQLSVLAGFRYLSLQEDLDGAFTVPGAGAPTISNHHADNNLYGFQIGGDYRTSMSERRVGLQLGGKAGIFGNDSRMHATATVPLLGPVAASASAGQTSFIGEINLVGLLRLRDHVYLRGGYQVMWIEGLALAPDQVATANFMGASTVNTGGGIFLHGAIAGLELRW